MGIEGSPDSTGSETLRGASDFLMAAAHVARFGFRNWARLDLLIQAHKDIKDGHLPDDSNDDDSGKPIRTITLA